MSFDIEPGEKPAQAVVRVATRDIDHCLAALARLDEDAELHVHGVRKRVKRLRAHLRLVRFSIPGKSYAKANAALRDASRLLATAREAAVRKRGLKLMLRSQPKKDEAFSQTVRKMVVKGDESPLPSGSNVAQARQLLLEAQAMFGRLKPGKGDWDLVGQGLRFSYAKGRGFMRRCLKRPSTHAFHEWRKWVKYQWHQVELLTPVWPEELGLRAKSLKHLADTLGDEHDLSDLRDSLLSKAVPMEFSGDLKQLLRTLDQRRAALRGDALRIGARLFAEKPRAFEERVEGYYKAFSSEGAALEPSPPDDQ